MPSIRKDIRFWLNDELIVLDHCSPSETLLDYLRLERRLTGTKEGCAEGDCGACTTLVGRLFQGTLIYESVNACIRFLPSLDGCHVVTIEGLRGTDGGLHPVQQAMVDHHGSQCGFCTPGIVMSLYALWMTDPEPTRDRIEEALQGNLCRCTGYAPIIRAAVAISGYGSPASDWLEQERKRNFKRLIDLKDGARVVLESDGRRAILPANLDDFSHVRLEEPDAIIVAGATDVGLWVTKQMRDLQTLIFIGHLEDMKTVICSQTHITIGAGVTYSEAQQAISGYFPHLDAFWRRIAGQQIRNMGTIGGNIANGSPIGDMPPVLIALGADLVLRKSWEQRTIRLEDFFLDYGKQDRWEGDFVEAIRIPIPGPGSLHGVYKISKRRDEDISSVCVAFHLVVSGGKIVKARIAFGGMAATPKRASEAEAALKGQAFSLAAMQAAADRLPLDFHPISDMRASADYRMRVAKNLFEQFWHDKRGALSLEAAE
ncbi:xanthine dehydrogenase small subunit [Cohaesibacter haloalkalitolerans]|uniref:xanthine dehydrogenase small subunit n=1 Tax=Cohaesibacter haloalkalitolerans TaxID=1162980 RepID=UPI000E659A2F|nr:xanthine dehydrogenase small subunit [Cohaesibacter haloalkalitolerans]